MAKFVVFGAGPGGLYTAWRLITGGALTSNDQVHLVEWGHYNFPGIKGGKRNPAGRICSYPYKGDSKNSYIEVGGMRYVEWDENTGVGHQLVTKTINDLGLADNVIDFNTTDNPLFYLRGEHFYNDQLLDGTKVAPYNTPGNNEKPASVLAANISDLLTGKPAPETVDAQCAFYSQGQLPEDFNSFVYNPGQTVSNIGYWNVFYDQAGNEGYNYFADAGGYSSNAINWNAANAAIYNSEFAPGGTAFKTLSTGYSSLFSELFAACMSESGGDNPSFEYVSKTRLHSIWTDNGTIQFRTASADNPDKAASNIETADKVFLALPPRAIELGAQATRYQDLPATANDFLNHHDVRNYLGSVILQPSYKVAMFFDSPWWENTTYPPDLTKTGADNVFGPSITDLPLRQVYYFGNNAPDQSGKPVYGVLASYDDMRFSTFWQEMQLSPSERRETSLAQNLQPMEEVGKAPEAMTRMLLLELAKLHYGHPDDAHKIPVPLETTYMDWGLNPFGAGYHAWAAHYDLVDVMDRIRTPAKMAGNDENNVFIVGSAFSNDQAWVEGAFATAESVLNDFIGVPTIAQRTDDYSLICPCGGQ